MTTARWLPAAAAALAAACAGAPPPLHHAPLHLEERVPGALAAYVQLRVAGKAMRLKVDTGSMWNVIPAAFAQAQKLPRRPAPTGVFMVDANGNPAPLVYLDRVPVQFDGEAAGVLDFVQGVEDAPYALFSPQDMVRRGWAVIIDLRRGELRYEEEAAALQRLRQEGPLEEAAFETCGLFNDAHRIVTVKINGVDARMAIDTGAECTLLARNNEALPSLLAAEGFRSKVAGVASIAQAVAVDEVPVEFGGISLRTPMLVTPARYECGRGLLGADVLRHCTLVWGKSQLWVSCRAPAAGDAGAGPGKS